MKTLQLLYNILAGRRRGVGNDAGSTFLCYTCRGGQLTEFSQKLATVKSPICHRLKKSFQEENTVPQATH